MSQHAAKFNRDLWIHIHTHELLIWKVKKWGEFLLTLVGTIIKHYCIHLNTVIIFFWHKNTVSVIFDPFCAPKSQT